MNSEIHNRYRWSWVLSLAVFIILRKSGAASKKIKYENDSEFCV